MKIYRILNSKCSYIAVDEDVDDNSKDVFVGRTVAMTTILKRLQWKMARCRQLLIREKAIMKLRKCVVAKR